jgi:hypothetical protein
MPDVEKSTLNERRRYLKRSDCERGTLPGDKECTSLSLGHGEAGDGNRERWLQECGVDGVDHVGAGDADRVAL